MTVYLRETIIKSRTRYTNEKHKGGECMRNLKALRVKYALTQEDLATILGISTMAYSNKENCKVGFTLKEAKIIADYFKLPIEEIFFVE